jgi:hypothetical protein
VNLKVLPLPQQTIQRELKRNPQAIILNDVNGPLILQQIADEVAVGNYPVNETFREVFRAVGFVNLWFFLKFICGFAGPFDLLNNNLHLDMCNFAHTMHVPGSKNAVFMPRKHFKTTIFNIGDSDWTLLRDPDEAISIFSGIFDRAMDFLHTAQRVFDSNELFKWLYPDYVGGKSNDGELVLPNRSRYYTEPSLRCGSVGGSSEGQHFTTIKMDDPVGLEQLDSMRRSNADMGKRRDWILSAQRTLLRNWRKNRVDLMATRYAIDDAYEPIMRDVKAISGCVDGISYSGDKTSEWNVYYRCVVEHGEIIFPENITQEGLDKMDPWDRATQYENNPQASGLAELSSYELKDCRLLYDDDRGYLVQFIEPGTGTIIESLSDMDVVVAGDPAGTEKYISAKTSRSALVCLARDAKDRKFFIEISADYYAMSRFFDMIFDLKQKFSLYIRKTLFEAQGPFRAVGNLLAAEQSKRGIWLSLEPVTAVGDKDARIRTLWEPELAKGLIYVVEAYKIKLSDEVKSFPQSNKKDIMDAGAIAIAGSRRPLTTEELELREKANEAWKERRVSYAGY